MARPGSFTLSVGGTKPSGPCPSCGGLAQATGVVYDSMKGLNSWEFACPGCGAAMNFTCVSWEDPHQVLTRWAAQGAMPPGASLVLAAPMTGVYASGGYVHGPSVGQIFPSYSLSPPSEPTEPPEPGPELRSIVGSFVGYRAWQINHWALTGTGAGAGYPAWTPGVNRATCYTGHRAPAEGCHCGFNALARFKDDAAWWDTSNGPFEVVGAIEAWADERENNLDGFFLHSTGFRAEYARIVLLAVSDEYPRAKNAAIRSLAAEHQADVCKREHLEAAAGEHGQLVPDELLEWATEPSGLEKLRQVNHGILNFQTLLGVSAQQTQALFQSWLSPPLPAPQTAPRQQRRQRAKRPIAEIRKTRGAPATGKHRLNKRILDSAGTVWLCTKGGTPGTWIEDPDQAYELPKRKTY